jgi:polysaccharide deacetylase family protein (PEP-CTERM system associated)
MPPIHIFSVDVEDWFHLFDTNGFADPAVWPDLPTRVERNFNRLLDLFATYNVRTTCFFLGWIAERYPQLVKAAAAQGHEIASHGYFHRLVYQMTRAEFLQDALRARKLLEDTAGCRVLGYRAPGFSCTGRTPWFFEELARSGHSYDTSVFPARRFHGGMPGGKRSPYTVNTPFGIVTEIPATVADAFGQVLSFFGGGYLRLFPMWLVRQMIGRVSSEGRPVVFYVHPREIDPEQPRLPMNMLWSFKSYVNLATTEAKLRCILLEFRMTTFREFLYGAPVITEKTFAAGTGGGPLPTSVR